MRTLNLKRFQADSFLGIDSTAPIILDFSEANQKGENITLLEGEQGVGKTSTITALRFALADTLEIEQEKLINLKDHRISINLDFEVDGETYRVRATKHQFRLDKYLNEHNAWLPMSEPKTALKKLIGTIGVSPMYLKEAKGREQIKIFRESFGDFKVVDEQEQKILESLSSATEVRKEANKNYERIKAALESDELYLNYEESQQRFSTEVSIDAAREKLNTTAAAKAKYESGSNRLEFLKTVSLPGTQHQIRQLEETLKKLREEEAKVLADIEVGEQWLKDNENMKTDFEKAQEEYEQVNSFIALKKRWQEIVQQEQEMHEFEGLVQGADSTKDSLRKQLLQLTNSYKPNIEGLEIKVSTELTDTQEGIFYNGLALAQLSESELWDLYMKVWNQKNVQLVFVENLSSLGSHAVETLNHLAANGVKIFASQVRRGQERMQISFTDKIV